MLANTRVQVVVDAAHHLGVEVALERLIVGHGVDALEDGVALPGVRVYVIVVVDDPFVCLLYTSPSPRDRSLSRMPSSA